MQFKFLVHILISTFCIAGCKPGNTRKSDAQQERGNSEVKLARRFSILKTGSAFKVSVFGNRQTNDTTSVFIVAHDTTGLRAEFPEAYIVKSPCRKIAALSSIYANMFYELGALNAVAAIDNMDYIINPAIIEKHTREPLPELAKAPRVDVEQVAALKPDIIFTFGMGEGEKDIDKKLEQTGIPVAISVDHLEKSPLARAEWIKFFAVFVDKLERADSIFSSVEREYNMLKELAVGVDKKPTVFSEIKYSEFWYMPGGRSYVACLFKDAGANYLWNDNRDFGSLPLSFEQVYSRARQADFWINLSMLKTKHELLASESRYEGFKAVKTGNLFNNNRHVNRLGYSDYWETGMIYPNRILSDFLQIFHPQLRSRIKKDLYYYQQLK
jgi:iron complex transport system substrate-binding protein